MAITFKDAFHGMAQMMPQLVNQYFNYMQLQLDYQRTETYKTYMTAEAEQTEIQTEAAKFDLEQNRKLAPSLVRTRESEERVAILAEKAANQRHEAREKYPGGGVQYEADKLTNEINAQKETITALRTQIQKDESIMETQVGQQAVIELQRQGAMLDILGTMRSISKNPDVLTKVLKSFEDEGIEPSVADIMERSIDMGVEFETPEERQNYFDGLNAIKNIITQTTLTDVEQKSNFVNGLLDFENKQYDKDRKALGIKESTPPSARIRMATEEANRLFPLRRGMINEMISSINTMNRAQGLRTMELIPEGTEQKPEILTNPYDTSNPSIFDRNFGVGGSGSLGGGLPGLTYDILKRAPEGWTGIEMGYRRGMGKLFPQIGRVEQKISGLEQKYLKEPLGKFITKQRNIYGQ